MAQLHLKQVSKRFPDGTTAVDSVNLEVVDRELLVLVGPSGCGKSTTLRMIAGLETESEGEIRIGERRVNGVPARDRDIAMVFQNYALYPHMTVYRNLAFGLFLRTGGGWVARALRRLVRPREAAELARRRREVDGLVRSTADRLGIAKLLDRKPHQLSGGERQRVALGRAMVREPAAFLFDEPLSNLDAKLRQQMRAELKRLHRELKATMVYVTHDQVEAMTLGDRVAVMNRGRILQVGRPLEVYQRPANLFVARFFGSAPINLWRGTAEHRNEQIHLGDKSTSTVQWTLPAERVPIASKLRKPREVLAGVRPEDLRQVADGESGDVRGTVLQIDQLGDSSLLTVQVPPESGSAGWNVPEGTLTARVDASSGLERGAEVELRIDPDRVIWLDPDSGDNLWKAES